MAQSVGPLTGFRVLDISTMIAAPFAAALLGDMGAEIIKVELPGSGDTLRHVAPMYANRSLYWSVLGRNKCSITLDLHAPRGRELFLELVKRSDGIIENFRPGTLERWDLGYETLKGTNPGVVLVRVSGYGQDGPYKDKAGFGTPAAAMGGLTYITGYPDRPPITVPIALADYLAGLFGALGALAALLERERNGRGGLRLDRGLGHPHQRHRGHFHRSRHERGGQRLLGDDRLGRRPYVLRDDLRWQRELHGQRDAHVCGVLETVPGAVPAGDCEINRTLGLSLTSW